MSAPPRIRTWYARATEASVAEMRAILDAGDVLVPVREKGRRPPPVSGALPPQSVIIRTSGSTGHPRDIVLPYQAFVASATATVERLDLRRSDVWWASLPPAHVGGLTLLLRAAQVGCGVEYSDGFDASTFWRLCAEHRITHASMVPTMLRRVLEAAPADADPSSLRTVLIGGAASDTGLLKHATRMGIPVAVTWGMTETCSQLSTATPDETAVDPTHSGRLLRGVELQDDPVGRLSVRTPTMSLGELVDGVLVPLADPDGWFATDDLGDQDTDGFVRITGRVSDRIISGGVNVDPVMIERELRTLPWIEDVAVLGLPDEEWGERVTAVVVVGIAEARSDEQLLASLPETLSAAYRPKTLVRMAALPLNANGKVDRPALRRQLS